MEISNKEVHLHHITIKPIRKMENLAQFELRNGSEKVIFKFTKQFYIDEFKYSEIDAEKEAIRKIINVRKMSKEVSNPRSKSYFPY